MMGDAAHRSPALAHRSGGEGDAHDRGRLPGVVVEDLVEVAQTEEEDGVGVPPLGLPVLPHGRRDRPGRALRPTREPATAPGVLRLPVVGPGPRRGGHATGDPASWPALASSTRTRTSSPMPHANRRSGPAPTSPAGRAGLITVRFPSRLRP